MKSKAKRPPSGEIRQSQILSTFGPGAMVDLPDYSVLIGGLNHWKGDRRRIYEDRLLEELARFSVSIALPCTPPCGRTRPSGTAYRDNGVYLPSLVCGAGSKRLGRHPAGKNIGRDL
jgi:hypothetical protein